jgi:pterin-4a-carbinolamine dehydratase
VAKRSEHSQLLADKAVRRGWSYSQRGAHLHLETRWEWHVRFEHPFQWKGHGRGLDRRVPVCDVLCGATPAGRPFWSFWYPITAGAWGLHGSFITRSVAFVYTASTLPTVSVAARRRIDTRPIMSQLDEAKGRKMRQSPGGETERVGRLYGWPVGSDEFQRRYKVKADSRQAAEWLARPAIQAQLLEHDPVISLTSNGTDILAWTDHGSSHIAAVEDYDLPTVDAMLAVLDTVELPGPASTPP